MGSLNGQRLISIEDMGAIAIPDELQTVVGTTATKLTPPADARAIIVMADKGGWRIRVGDFVSAGMPASEIPSSSISNGTSGWYIPALGAYVIPAGVFTVKGYAADSALTYGWL